MVYAENFIVRKSGIKEDNYYIDYQGVYKLADLAQITGLKPALILKIYISNGAVYDEPRDVYYFSVADNARESISLMIKNIETDRICKAVYLTDQEIQYIRQALINEGANTINLKNNIKDNIFKKLNKA